MRSRLLIFLLIAAACWGQPPAAPSAPDPLDPVKFRLIGPFRGGRVVAVAGVPSQPNTYYFGGTGGGVFKTTDAGLTWTPISDGQFKTGSVGSIAVAPSDPNVIYVGMGESCIRGNASHGDGVYKSVDAGRTWTNIGLTDTRQIGRVRVHPTNSDIVWVAALGHMSGPNEERGVFRSTDGGKSWKQVLTRGPKAGAVDLALDPTNPRILYATFWETIRKPWTYESGGPGSGLWKSTDGGETWTDITRNAGLPKGVLGRIGVTVSGANGDRVWAIVEAEDGGVFRSDDGGKTWGKVNDERRLRQRAWYYSHIYADPKRADVVYVQNTSFYRSDDAGRTWKAIPTPHGDDHDLWIAPDDPDRMIEGNDGGANVSTNGGATWSTQSNQPTAQFYRVTTDNEYPYRVYGAQQDNTTVRTASRANGPITEQDWHPVGGGESGWIAPDPRQPDVVYAGSYGGYLTRYDHRSRSTSVVNVWPDNPMGYGVEGMRYRFQWNFPIAFSLHEAGVLYAAGNRLFRSTNGGQSWTAISPDLTRNDPSKQGPSGGPITKDNSGVEYYDTIFAFAESPVTRGVLWAGSDDGLVHVSRDAGKTWTNVTPPGIPEWIQINSIEASPHDGATAFIAATMYKHDDFRPYLYRTTDSGKTWQTIVNGIPETAFARVIREDPRKRGLLFAGTQTGLYVSYDNGVRWSAFQRNLPVVPITDLAFHKREDELVVATEGRSFWILDDLPLVRELAGGPPSKALLPVKETVRGSGAARGPRVPAQGGENPQAGAVVHYWLAEKPRGDVTLEFLDGSGKLIRKVTSAAPAKTGESGESSEETGGAPPRATANAGMNRFSWDLRYPDASRFPGMILWAGSVTGPMVTPGAYRVRLTVDGKSEMQNFTVRPDPRISTTPEQYAKQLALGLQIRDKLSEANDAVVQIREIKRQLAAYEMAGNAKVTEAAKALGKKLTEVEEELYQTKNRSNQDPLNYPIKLNNKLAALGSVISANTEGPTEQSLMLYEELATKVNGQTKRLAALLEDEVASFNSLVRSENVPALRPAMKTPE